MVGTALTRRAIPGACVTGAIIVPPLRPSALSFARLVSVRRRGATVADNDDVSVRSPGRHSHGTGRHRRELRRYRRRPTGRADGERPLASEVAGKCRYGRAYAK